MAPAARCTNTSQRREMKTISAEGKEENHINCSHPPGSPGQQRINDSVLTNNRACHPLLCCLGSEFIATHVWVTCTRVINHNDQWNDHLLSQIVAGTLHPPPQNLLVRTFRGTNVRLRSRKSIPLLLPCSPLLASICISR